jgi:ATP-dependent DNA helicase PIF1
MDQQLALDILKSGHNVLLTGSAGTGKTYVLNQFITHLREHSVKHAVTASTGLAATHLNGVTIHSWAKIGIKNYIPNNFAAKMAEKERERIKNTSVLIIDEISMLHDYRLDMVNKVCQKVRESTRPFGGIQIILCGDFFQLPPINRDDDEIQGGFVVGSKSWEDSGFVVCYLDKAYRQADDQEFKDILDAIRAGDVRRRHAESLLARVKIVNESDIRPTQLSYVSYQPRAKSSRQKLQVAKKTSTSSKNTALHQSCSS